MDHLHVQFCHCLSCFLQTHDIHCLFISTMQLFYHSYSFMSMIRSDKFDKSKIPSSANFNTRFGTPIANEVGFSKAFFCSSILMCFPNSFGIVMWRSDNGLMLMRYPKLTSITQCSGLQRCKEWELKVHFASSFESRGTSNREVSALFESEEVCHHAAVPIAVDAFLKSINTDEATFKRELNTVLIKTIIFIFKNYIRPEIGSLLKRWHCCCIKCYSVFCIPFLSSSLERNSMQKIPLVLQTFPSSFALHQAENQVCHAFVTIGEYSQE